MQFNAQEEFTEELENIIEYYNTIDPELVSRFVFDLKEMKSHISLFPEACPSTKKPPMRKHLLRKFPFRVRYMQEDDTIILFSIDHMSKNSEM